MDLIAGLGGPAGFGENLGPTGDDDASGPIDLSSVFPEGLTFFGQRYDSVFVNSNGNLTFDRRFFEYLPEDIATLDVAGLYPFWTDILVRTGTTDPGPDGTSTGSNSIWYDLDPDAGTFTVTWDDVTPYDFDQHDRSNAFQIRLVDISDEEGRLAGDFRVELRYEEIEWTWGIDEPSVSTARIGFTVGDGDSFTELDASNDGELLSLLPSRGVLSYTFDATGISDGQGRPPIRGTDGDDDLTGTDEPEAFLPGRGDDVVRPGLGADQIVLRGGAKIVSGSAEALLGDRLIGAGRDDLLFFEGAQFTTDAMQVAEDGRTLDFDIDGDGASDGRIDLGTRVQSRDVFAFATEAGTTVGYLRDLPDSSGGAAVAAPQRYQDVAVTSRYLTGDGSTDFTVTVHGMSTAGPGTALGVYAIEADGGIGAARLLTTDVAASGRAAFTVEDVAAGEELALFVLRPEPGTDLDVADSFAFVDQSGGAADLDDRSYVFAATDGAIVAGDLFHSADAFLNQDLRTHVVVGHAEGASGLTFGFEDEMFAEDGDFDDVVVTIERAAADLL